MTLFKKDYLKFIKKYSYGIYYKLCIKKTLLYFLKSFSFESFKYMTKGLIDVLVSLKFKYSY